MEQVLKYSCLSLRPAEPCTEVPPVQHCEGSLGLGCRRHVRRASPSGWKFTCLEKLPCLTKLPCLLQF